MFTSEERTRLRTYLLEAAARDRRITGGAITGSASQGREDRWSDIDLAFGVRKPDEMGNVVADWTARMYKDHQALHHVDVLAGPWLYRVFLLPRTLQVDLAFAPEASFRPLAPTFRLVFGKANEAQPRSSSTTEELIGLAWLHALHARTCIARGKLWQAEYMISGTRDYALALACLRHDQPVFHARGIDNVPKEVTSRFEGGLVQRLETGELSRAFTVVIQGLLLEIETADQALFERLRGVLNSLIDDAEDNDTI